MGFYRVTKKQSGEGIPLITKSGSIVEFEDSIGGVPVNDLVAQIVANLSGFTGVNVMVLKNQLVYDNNEQSGTTNGVIWSFSGGKLTLSGTATADVSLVFPFSQTVNLSPSTNKIYFNNTSAQSQISVYFRRNGTNIHYWYLTSVNRVVENWTDSGNENVDDIRISIPNGQSVSLSIFPWLVTKNYAPNTYSVTWQTEAGTVYGGYIDLTTGLLTVTWGGDDLGSLTWERVTSGESPYFRSNVSNYKYMSSNNNVLCDGYSYANVGATGSDSGFIILSSLQLRIRDNTYATAQDFKSAMNGHMIVFELATPHTYQLTPTEVATILGTNYIFADTGNVSVKLYKPVTNLDTLVEQTKDLAPDLLKMVSGGNGSTTRVGVDLTDDTIGTKAIRIPDYMFFKNNNIEKIDLSTITEVGEYTFENAKYITKINLPNCVTIKKEAFYNACTSHTSSTLSSIVINLPNVLVVADRALSQIGYSTGLPATLTLTACTEIKANGIRGLGSAYMRINELLLPALQILGQESMNYNVFGTVDIGENCTTINSKPFNYCTVDTLIVRATTPPTLHANGLGVTPTHIYVPADSVATYKAASNWSTYASIIEAIPT